MSILYKKIVFISCCIVAGIVITVALFMFRTKQDTTVQRDVVCEKAVGAESYISDIDTYETPEILLERGTVITVTNNTDSINGDVSSVNSLLAYPGPDGISLREAMEAMREDPGNYTIQFAKHLQGTVINVGVSEGHSLPLLSGGGVIINGDISGDGKPDITIRNEGIRGDPSFGFKISSGDNVLHALAIEQFTTGVAFMPFDNKDKVFANNTISNMVIQGAHDGGIVLRSFVPRPLPEEMVTTGNTWKNIVIVGNDIEAQLGGINLLLHFLKGDRVEGTRILNNTISLTGVEFSEGISLTAGLWGGADSNTITDTVIADNTIHVEGAPSSMGIRVAAGDNGASDNTVSDIIVSNNVVKMIPGSDDEPVAAGIMISAGDSSTVHDDPEYRPIIYPENNILQNVHVTGNAISGLGNHGIYAMSGILGAAYSDMKDIIIAGNTIDITPSYIMYKSSPGGIGIYSGPFAGGREDFEGGRSSYSNTASNITIEWNTVMLSDPHRSDIYGGFGRPPLPGKPEGIIIYEAKRNNVETIQVFYNIVRGGGVHTTLKSSRNDVVDVGCNTVE